jgi:nucleotide-binding universal stress UspA family protein
MKLLEKILVATDFGSGSQDALRKAVFVAKHFHSQITLLHVVPGSARRYWRAAGMIRTDVEEELRDIAEHTPTEGIPDIRTVVDFGIPFDRIRHHADEQDVNVIFVGAREAAEDPPPGLGSTASAVRRYANKPVWIVKAGQALPITKILCPVDLSVVSGRALRNAIHLSRNLQAELSVLRVVPEASRSHKGPGKTDVEAEETDVRHEQLELDRFVRDFDFHNVQWNKLIRRGRPHEEIPKVVKQRQSDLLVIGSAGRTGLGRMFTGGVARKVARELPCSMFTIRAEHAIRLRVDTESADIEAHFKLGHELLALGFPQEAAAEFRHCIEKDNDYAPAWEGLAAVHERLGRHEEARQYEEQAEHIFQTLYYKQIEAEIRGQHPLFRPFFGVK